MVQQWAHASVPRAATPLSGLWGLLLWSAADARQGPRAWLGPAARGGRLPETIAVRQGWPPAPDPASHVFGAAACPGAWRF